MSVLSTSQDNFQIQRNERFLKAKQVKNLTEVGRKAIYMYDSLAVEEAMKYRMSNAKIPIFHDEYMPDFTQYQYDLELFIFLNYSDLYKRELELAPSSKVKILESKGAEYGATFLKRQEHLENAISIRWPEKILPTGDVSTAFALTPWAKDYLYGLSNYNNIVTFGGGGQGKTYSALAFQVMLYDHFIHTKAGAQCSFSTVSENKLKTSAWSHVNKLYSFKNPYKISMYANLAHAAPDYTFRRKTMAGKYIEEGGTLKGILLVQGAKTAKQIDKLTGQHDVMARVYLLDEAQSTGPAPLSAYNNMFLHPKYGWFLMCGNYELDEDLLGINTEPDTGWESVNENTHMWESTLKSPDSDLGHKSLVIHYNNELSPGMTSKEMARKYGKFVMTPEKKKKLYKTKEEEETYEGKRFWVGFRFERKKNESEKVLTTELIKEFKGCDNKDFRTDFTVASLDSASSGEGDRNVLTLIDVGLNDKGYPMFAPARVFCLTKPLSQLTYYKETCLKIKEILDDNRVESGHSIMDWTQRTQLLEGLMELGVVFHHLIYQQHPPKENSVNEVTKISERPVELEKVKTFSGEFEKDVTVYAHEKIENRITLGAYILRLFLEAGCVRNLNASLLNGIPNAKSFEKEICLRSFEIKQTTNRRRITLDSKDKFKSKHKFSPDVLDTLFQAAYMLYVIFDIRPNKKGLGSLRKRQVKKPIDNKIWDARLRFRK